MRRLFWLALSFVLLATGAARAEGDVIVVFDASNSMWGQIGGIAKIEIAREVMGDLLVDWDPDTNLGLVLYGHRTTDDCSDIETVIPPGPLDATAFTAEINAITPRGRTPLTDAVEHAANELAYRDNPGTVILISDGIESCDRDPCDLAETLAQNGIDFTAHVIGFGLAADQDTETLSCIAEATGGLFLTAQDAGELTDALDEIAAQVTQAPPPEPAPPEPEPEPEPLPAVVVTAPAQATVGAVFQVEWTPIVGDRDYVTIVPVGADEGEVANSVRTNADQPADLRAPADPGLYEVRYVADDGRATLGMAEIEIVDAAITITAPPQATAGATFPVEWSETIDGRDYVTIVPIGTDEGQLRNSVRANADQPASLQAPAEPGLYEIRYVLDVGRRTIGVAPIEIVEAEVTLTAPETATAGATFAVEWSATIDGRDFITIVPLGTDEGVLGNYVRANADQPGLLQAPAEPGFYEIRYVLNEGRVTLASVQIEIVGSDVTLVAPETATAGATFPVEWSTTIDGRDFITIVPLGTDEGVLGNYVRANADQPGLLQAPAEPGFYEIRYVLNEGRVTLASVQIEIVGSDVTLVAPETATAGATFPVEWSTTIDGRDFITIVPLGTNEGELGNYVRANADQPGRLQAPAEPGFYEIRYVLNEGRITLASVQIEIIGAEVTLVVPASAVAGATFPVEWSTTIDGGDFITIVPLGADEGELGNYVRANADQPGDLQAPAGPGFYEVRYVLNEGRVTLASVQIEIVEGEVTLEASPTVVRAEDRIQVTWTGTVDGRDFITIVPLGTDEGELGNYVRANANQPGNIEAPAEPGLYEIRYVLNEGRRTMATVQIEVVPADAALNTGAVLEVPETVAPGETFAVNWTVDVAGGDQRVTLAATNQADFTWIAMQPAAGGPPLEFQAPDTPGFYEIRFLDIAGQQVLSRVIFEVR